MAWMCESGEHVMEKPNLAWDTAPLDRPAKTKAEKRSKKMWTPICLACIEAAEQPSGIAWLAGMDGNTRDARP